MQQGINHRAEERFCSILLENTGLHQIRANKELDKSQQASHCLRKQMFMEHITLQHQGKEFLGTFHTWKYFSSHPWLACLIPVIPPGDLNPPHTPKWHWSCFHTWLSIFSPGPLQVRQPPRAARVMYEIPGGKRTRWARSQLKWNHCPNLILIGRWQRAGSLAGLEAMGPQGSWGLRGPLGTRTACLVSQG